MENLSTYVEEAIRTECHVDSIETNYRVLIGLLKAQIEIGKCLDLLKKEIFYGKEVSEEEIETRIRAAFISLPIPFGVKNLSEVKHITANTRLFHAIIGIVTESSELTEALLEGINSETDEFDRVNILEELGDLNWYQAIAIDTLSGSFQDVLRANIAKLYARYPEKFSQDAAINRDLTNERQVLEDNTD